MVNDYSTKHNGADGAVGGMAELPADCRAGTSSGLSGGDLLRNVGGNNRRTIPSVPSSLLGRRPSPAASPRHPAPARRQAMSCTRALNATSKLLSLDT